jgi:hypothetical protein
MSQLFKDLLLKDLLAIDNLLSDETKWCQNTFARDKNGKPVSPYSYRARSWCLTGAISRTFGDRFSGKNDVITELNAAIGETKENNIWKQYNNLSKFNDKADFAAIKDLLAVTIRRVESGGHPAQHGSIHVHSYRDIVSHQTEGE